MSFNLAMDLLMAVLLTLSIGTCFALNRRLNGLRGGQAELEKLAASFHDSTRRAEEGTTGLKLSAEALRDHIERARSLADDLEFLIERGGSAADRLEASVRAARMPEPRMPEPQTRAPSAKVAAFDAETLAAGSRSQRPQTAATAARSEAERHLLAAMRARG